VCVVSVLTAVTNKMADKMFEKANVTQDWSVHSFQKIFIVFIAHVIVLDTEDIKMNE
jgi:hypothetical protein